jgi:CheY-like chemotaxis protein
VKRVFIKFYGFSDTERHALDTLFRLSESRYTIYSAWTPQAAETGAVPDIVMIDGDSWEAVLALANPSHDALKIIWVGDKPPEQAWRVFPAPVKWSAVVEVMDQAFAPLSSLALSLDLDLAPTQDLDVQIDGNDDTAPLPLEAGAAPAAARRVLVVDAGRDERLYLRAKLASAGLFEVDEAASGAEALALLSAHPYQLVTVDLGLTDMDSWQVVKAVDSARPAVAHLFVTGAAPAGRPAVRARFFGAQAYLRKPLHPGRLRRLLQNI